MSLTRNGERLFRWAVENQKELRSSEAEETFWKKKEVEGNGVVQYHVETLQEMKQFLEQTGIENMAALIFGAEAMKHKMRYYREEEEHTRQQSPGYVQVDDIPDYVYMF